MLTGIERDPEAVRAQARRPRPDHPRHDARDQRDHRAQGRQDGADRHRGLPRLHRDRLRAPLRAVRHLHAEAAAAGAARLRFGVPERMDGRGNVLIPLDEAAVRGLAPKLKAAGIEASPSATCTPISTASTSGARAISSASCCPACRSRSPARSRPRSASTSASRPPVANAYVQPLMARYLGRLDEALRKQGVACPLFLMTSGGGLDDARDRAQVPGPAGRVGPGRRRDPRGGARARSAASTRCCRSTWAAPPPRSA